MCVCVCVCVCARARVRASVRACLKPFFKKKKEISDRIGVLRQFVSFIMFAYFDSVNVAVSVVVKTGSKRYLMCFDAG